MKKFKCGLYYGVMILLFLVVEPIIGYLRFSDKVSVENNVLELSNNDLKQKLEELSQIAYEDYNYILAKVTIRSLYNSQYYFLDSAYSFKDNAPVINQFGLIGVTDKNKTLKASQSLKLSVKVNNIIGILEGGILNIEGDFKVGDKVYTSGLTNMPRNILVGEIKSIDKGSIKVEYVDNTSNYVAILKDYSL